MTQMTSLQDEFSIGAVLGLNSSVRIQYFNEMWYVGRGYQDDILRIMSVPG